MKKLKHTSPLSWDTNLHKADKQEIITFLNTYSKSFDSLGNLGTFIDDLKITKKKAFKAKGKVLVVERYTYTMESPGEDYSKSKGKVKKSIFDYDYDLPDTFPKKRTDKVSTVLKNTVETFSCSPEAVCTSCKGSGRCRQCYSKGFLRCSSCGGSGVRAGTKSKSRGGLFNENMCFSCGGDGRKDCYNCSGTGGCNRCSSSGKIVCERCEGKGAYQKFQGFNTHFSSKSYEVAFSDHPELEKILFKTENKVIFEDDLIEWTDAENILFDNSDKLLEINEKTDVLISCIQKQNELSKNNSIGRIYASVENIPITILDYTFENKNYQMFIVGKNNIVCYTEVPTKHYYRLGFFDRIINFFNKKKRRSAFLHIAWYMLNSDNEFNSDEKDFLKLFSGDIGLSDKEKDLVEQKFKSTPKLEGIEKYLKTVKKDKRALIFAWQCVCIDKDTSENEKKAFKDLSLLFDINEEDAEVIRQKSEQFSGLSMDAMLKEYFK